MAYHCKVLYEDASYISSLGGTFHRITPNIISFIVASITFNLINIIYSNIYSSIDDTSDDIWTGGVSDMGKLSSTRTLRKSSAAVII